ncbi:MAG: amidohydrolase family protein [Candidatus Marinimicrobia bacterium]|nr:amidohydrolase family protein [Candidatus Neomarinimicrobiota bacterium]MCF7827502.1 amidohydrolase family protein [Candidatus Neomarinimicrobiota bacterium]MCF7882368.1 amidohydrolase family protein [Candidatus Neomarinimicrobiota bacterium]
MTSGNPDNRDSAHSDPPSALLVKNIGELATVNPRIGQVEKYDHVSMEIIDGTVAGLFSGESVPFTGDYDAIIDAGGRLVTPGFVDPSTWLARSDTLQQLSAKKIQNYVGQFLRHGTTTVEMKIEVSLETEQTINAFSLLADSSDDNEIESVPTVYLTPGLQDNEESPGGKYLRELCENILPAIAEENVAEYCDLRYGTSGFPASDAEILINSAIDSGLNLRLETDGADADKATELAATYGAHSVTLIEEISEEGVANLDKADIVPIILPGVNLVRKDSSPIDIRKMVDIGLPVAVGSGYYFANVSTGNMQSVLNLSTTLYNLSIEEALQAATYHAAGALNREDAKGCLTPGYDADFILWEKKQLDDLAMEFGMNLLAGTFIGGNPMWQNQDLS